mgnify:CR=1 FL=1
MSLIFFRRTSTTRSAIHLIHGSPLSAASTKVILIPSALASTSICFLRSSRFGKLST